VPGQEARSVKRKARVRALDLGLALKHIRATDLHEVWVPDVLNFEDFIADSKSVLAESFNRIKQSGPFDPPIEVDVPKTPFFNRTASLLSFEDRVAYQALVATLADVVDDRLLPTVYSARISPSPVRFLKKDRDQWLLFRKTVAAAIDSGDEWMIKTDLSSYFDTIPHGLLFKDLDELKPDNIVSHALKRMISLCSNERGVGLVQGPNASRVLGNLYLQPVDAALSEGSWKYFRFMDDIRILARSRHEVTAGFRVLERECKRRCLLLSPQKTALKVGADAKADLEDSELDAAAYLFGGRREAARPALRQILRKAMVGSAQLNRRHAKFSIFRLTQIADPPEARVLDHIEDLAPVADVLAVFIRPWLRRNSVASRLAEFMNSQERNTSPYLSTWLMTALMERKAPLPAEWVSYGRRVSRDANQPQYHRAVSMSLLARGRQSGDIDWIQRTARGSYDPMIVRGALVALARIGQLDRTTGALAEAHVPTVARTVRYLQGRAGLPSLVKRGEWVAIDR
jgi:hypothetical protein